MGGRQLNQLWCQILQGRTKYFYPIPAFISSYPFLEEPTSRSKTWRFSPWIAPPSLYKQNKNLSQDSLQSFHFDTAANHHGPSAARPPRQPHDGHLHRQFQR